MAALLVSAALARIDYHVYIYFVSTRRGNSKRVDRMGEMNPPAFPTIPTAPITQTFNNHRPDLYAGDGKHKGVDYGIPTNTPVYACMDGVVEFAGIVNSGYGRHIRIQHADGSVSIYGHLNKFSVIRGQAVNAGDQIGLSGGDPKDSVPGDGHSTGAHLHFEIRPAGAASEQQAVDPEKYCLRYFPIPIGDATCTADNGLNVRAAPSTNAKILYSLHKGETVKMAFNKGEWTRLHALRPEWCVTEYLHAAKLENTEPTDAEKLAILWDAYKSQTPVINR